MSGFLYAKSNKHSLTYEIFIPWRTIKNLETGENKILSSFTKKFPAFLVSPKQSTGLLLGLSEAPCVF